MRGVGEGALVLKEANRKHLQGPLTWGGINLISALPSKDICKDGMGRGGYGSLGEGRLEQVQIKKVILRPRAAVGRVGQGGQVGGVVVSW